MDAWARMYRDEEELIALFIREEFTDMYNQTVVLNDHQTIYGATITTISYCGFWTYGRYNGSIVRTYEGWTSWEVVR